MFQVNYQGLKKRYTYDELVNYIEHNNDKIKYPDRQATFIEQSHDLKCRVVMIILKWNNNKTMQ